MNDLEQKWQDVEWVAFDTETTGKYPIESEICELAAVKWRGGKCVGTFSSLFSVKQPMSQEVINIHKITNEMLEGAPTLQSRLPEFVDFVGEAYLMAHHAPFDMGFLAIEFEKAKIRFFERPVFCTSLLAQKVWPQFPNHKLQTLVKCLKVEPRIAHRALSDAEACLDVGLACFKDAPVDGLRDLQSLQGKELQWQHFSLADLKEDEIFYKIVAALERSEPVDISYQGGSRPGKSRTLWPVGIVRNPGQDFLVARDQQGGSPKRYYFNRIKI